MKGFKYADISKTNIPIGKTTISGASLGSSDQES